MRNLLLLTSLAVVAGFIGKDQCKEMSCHANVNNAANARWKGNTRNTRYLGTFAYVSECEAACVNFKDKKGNTCKSFVYHTADFEGTCMTKRTCLDSQCFAVIDDTWEPKEQMHVISGKVGMAAASVINKAFTSVQNVTEEAVGSVMGASDAKSDTPKKAAAKPAAAPTKPKAEAAPKKEVPKEAPKPPPKAVKKEKKSSKMREAHGKEDGTFTGFVLVGSTTAVIMAAAFFITEGSTDEASPPAKAMTAQKAPAPAKAESGIDFFASIMPKLQPEEVKPVKLSAPAPATKASAPFSMFNFGGGDGKLDQLEKEFRNSGKIDREGAWLL